MVGSVGVKSQTDVLHISQLADGQLVKTFVQGKRGQSCPHVKKVKAAIVQFMKKECDEVMGGNLIGPKHWAEASLTAPPNPGFSQGVSVCVSVSRSRMCVHACIHSFKEECL